MNEESETKIDWENEELPWYLKNGWMSFYAFLLPPILYIMVLFNSKKLGLKKKSYYLFFANLMTSFWILRFLPFNIYTGLLVGTLLVLSGSFVIYGMTKWTDTN